MCEVLTKDFQNRKKAFKFCIGDGMKSICLHYKVESCDGTADKAFIYLN